MGERHGVRLRVRFGELLLAASGTFGVGEVPAWRWDMANRPYAVLCVGEPTPPIGGRDRARSLGRGPGR